MVEAQWRPSAGIFQRLSGESFVMTVDEAENSEVISSADLPFCFSYTLYHSKHLANNSTDYFTVSFSNDKDFNP